PFSQSMEGMGLARMKIEARNALGIVSHRKEDSEPPFIHLLVHEELSEAPVDLVLRRAAVRAEEFAFPTDRLVKRTLRLGCLRGFGVAQLELLDPALDGSHDGEQMEQLLDRINACLKLDRFPAWSLSCHG